MRARVSGVARAQSGSVNRGARVFGQPCAACHAVEPSRLSDPVKVALGHWTYAASMPVIPVLDAGLSPLAQWIAAASRLPGRLQRRALET